jgi:hypothetical protein
MNIAIAQAINSQDREQLTKNDMIQGVQPKLLLNLEKPKYRLIRERDKLIKESAEVLWLEWNEDGTFKDRFLEPAIGRSLVMSPFNDFFTWQTTTITEIVEQRDDYLKFKTENSNYELFKLKIN